MKEVVTIEAFVNAPVEKVWEYWARPEYIVIWTVEVDGWHTPHTTNDLRVGGTFFSRMEAKDGSVGFDVEGTYTTVEMHKKIGYTLRDGRNISIEFTDQDGGCKIVINFDVEDSVDMHRNAWQGILNNVKEDLEAG